MSSILSENNYNLWDKLKSNIMHFNLGRGDSPPNNWKRTYKNSHDMALNIKHIDLTTSKATTSSHFFTYCSDPPRY